METHKETKRNGKGGPGKKRRFFNYDYVRSYIEKTGDKLVTASYAGFHKHLEIQCGVCDDVFQKTFYYYHDEDKRCPKCFSENQYSYAEIDEIIRKAGDKRIGKFMTVNDNLDIECGRCHKISAMRVDHYIKGSRCGDCVAKDVGKMFALPYETVRDYISDCGDFLVSKTYHNYDGPLEICCHGCGGTYIKSFAQFKSKGRCDKCKDPMSRGERRIATYLTKKLLEYEHEYSYDDCRKILPLPFDFHIPSLSMCIEYQGQQHYGPIACFGGEAAFERQKERDKIKFDYCGEKKIPLLIIPYWDFSRIEGIMDEFINGLQHKEKPRPLIIKKSNPMEV